MTSMNTKRQTSWFRRRKLEDVKADELYDAERKLLEAEAAAEAWLSQRDMLRARVRRLRAPTLTEVVS